jgi:plastocyanin
MIRRLAAVAAVVAVLGACSSGGGGGERQVLVDYSTDEFASFIAQDFPRKIEITPGQTVVWKQTWTGEPHTVTGGSTTNAKLASSVDLLKLFHGYDELRGDNPDMINPEDAGDATMADFFGTLKAAKPTSKRDEVVAAYKTVRKAHPELPDYDHPTSEPVSEFNSQMDDIAGGVFDGFPFAGDDSGNIVQNVGQRCFLKSGAPPDNPKQACTNDQQRQPVFDGTYSFYNSGILPYEGPRGNTYRVKFSPKTKPGTYYFYCAIHGPNQLSEVVVKPAGSKVPSASSIAHQGRKAADEEIAPLRKTYRDAVKNGKVDIDGKKVSGPFAGLPSSTEGSINEFLPRTLHVKVNEPITWKIAGSDHTISFDVPPYLPIVEFKPDGTIQFNKKVRDQAGGAPAVPDEGDEGQPHKIDGGTYDGTGFWSSGVVGGDPYREYTLRISKKGTYNYACLIHPRMIGKVVVS